MAFIQDTGWLYPVSGVSEAFSGSTTPWLNPDRILDDDSSEASTGFLFNANEYSNYLRYRGISGLDFPEKVIILGVEARFQRRSSVSNSVAKDKAVRLFVGSSAVGDDKSNTDFWNLASPGGGPVPEYGGANDLWGINLTQDQVESADFGFVVAWYMTNGVDNLVDLDYMQMKITYRPFDTLFLTL